MLGGPLAQETEKPVGSCHSSDSLWKHTNLRNCTRTRYGSQASLSRGYLFLSFALKDFNSSSSAGGSVLTRKLLHSPPEDSATDPGTSYHKSDFLETSSQKGTVGYVVALIAFTPCVVVYVVTFSKIIIVRGKVLTHGKVPETQLNGSTLPSGAIAIHLSCGNCKANFCKLSPRNLESTFYDSLSFERVEFITTRHSAAAA